MGRLVVIVPGLSRRLSEWSDLVDRLKREPEFADARWLMWDHGLKVYTRGRPYDKAVELKAEIDQEWIAHGPFEDIILVGHSTGGLLVRQAYLIGCGVDHKLRQPSVWASHVTRILLFAGLNRGIDPRRSFVLRIASWLSRTITILQSFTPWHLFRGSNFITNIRIQWLRHFAGLEPGDTSQIPIVVQLLGTGDTLVDLDDSVDIEQSSRGYYIQIPQASHNNLHILEASRDPDARYALLRSAFVGNAGPALKNRSFSGASHVIFVVHGIRANNRTWVKETVEKISSGQPKVNPAVQAVGLPYRFMSAVEFAVPMLRRRHMRLLQDAYSEALARNPNTVFSYIGHSNGTYIFGECLSNVPGMKFERAALIGSVLPEDYDWKTRFQLGQIQSLRVDGSQYDWPVGWLCSILNGIGMKDVGTGGYDGFKRTNGINHHEFFWYPGGHSEPLSTSNLDALAQYAINGTVIAPPALGQEATWFSFVSRALRGLSPYVLIMSVPLIIYAAYVRPGGTMIGVGTVAGALAVLSWI